MRDVGKLYMTYNDVIDKNDNYILLRDDFEYYYINLENADCYFEYEQEFSNINANSCFTEKVYMKNTIENIINVLNNVRNTEFNFDYYWYSTIEDYSELKPVSEFNIFEDDYKLKQDIAHHEPRYIYIKRHDEDTYCIRYEIIYDEGNKKEQVTKRPVVKEEKQNKGENIMENFKDLFTFKQIDVKMDFMSGGLVLDNEGHYFSNGQVMQTLPEMTVKMPAYIISTPVAQLVVGDIIMHDNEYVCLLKVTGNFEGVNLKGEIIKFTVPTHALFGTNMQLLPKVMSPFQNMNMNCGTANQVPFGQFNPMALAFMENEEQGEKMTIEKMMKYSFYSQIMANFQPFMTPNTPVLYAKSANIVKPTVNTNNNVDNTEEIFEEGEDGVAE